VLPLSTESQDDENHAPAQASNTARPSQEHKDGDRTLQPPRKKKRRKRANVRLIAGLSVGGALLVALVALVVIGDSLGWISVLPSGTGEVSSIDPNAVMSYFDTQSKSGRTVTMADVEAKLGARGKRMSRADLQQEKYAALLNRELDLNPKLTCYRWSDGTSTLYLFFDRNVYTGAIVTTGQ
jgi:hypothetical protein